jgi:DNA-binding CsgD family transcriptional regulator
MPNVLFEVLCATLDHFNAGFLAVFPDGKILHANRMAHQMMSEGWPIQSNNGVLQAWGKRATALLLKSLRQVAEATEDPAPEDCLDICLANAASPKGVAIATMTLLADAKLNPPPVALFVTKFGNRSDCALSAIAECFGLTRAETRTLHHFMEGGTVAEAAHALAVSENTVKTHLQNIFAKTRSSRQAQLMKLVNDLRPRLRQIPGADASSENETAQVSSRSCQSQSIAVRL